MRPFLLSVRNGNRQFVAASDQARDLEVFHRFCRTGKDAQLKGFVASFVANQKLINGHPAFYRAQVGELTDAGNLFLDW
jgi:hypothetical protein